MVILFAVSFTSCGDDEPEIVIEPAQFTITLENVSEANLIATERAEGTVPMSPPVFTTYEGNDPMYQVGERANLATERIAEDGAFDVMLSRLAQDSNVKESDAVTSPGGPGDNGAVFFGESVTYTFTADGNDRLQFMTMFVQSNDWFMSFPENGLDLFDENGIALSGDLSSQVRIYDSGTEVDTAPGTGPDQKPAQDAVVLDQGPKEDEDIALVSDRHVFNVPNATEVIKFTITNDQ